MGVVCCGFQGENSAPCLTGPVISAVSYLRRRSAGTLGWTFASAGTCQRTEKSRFNRRPPRWSRRPPCSTRSTRSESTTPPCDTLGTSPSTPYTHPPTSSRVQVDGVGYPVRQGVRLPKHPDTFGNPSLPPRAVQVKLEVLAWASWLGARLSESRWISGVDLRPAAAALYAHCALIQVSESNGSPTPSL
jgi:hypothetical protein